MDMAKDVKKGRYIAVKLVQSKKAKRAKKPSAKQKETKPFVQPPHKPDETMQEKPRFTEYSEEAPILEYREEAVLENEGHDHGQEEFGGIDFGSDDEEIHYEPFHRVSVLPSFKVQINPVYPPSERAAGKETKVIVEVYINERGGVDHVEIVKSGGKLFDEAVISAIKKSSFTPAVMEGNLVAVRVKIPYTFKLK